MAKKRMHMCKKSHRPYHCRKWIRRREQHTLKRIAKICPTAVCKHLGYCTESIEKSKIERIVDSPSVWLELLDQKLENHFTKDVCNEFEHLQAICTQLAASVDGRRYAKMYMAMLHNDTTWIDNDIRETTELSQAGSNTDTCETCKNIVQSSTTFNLQIVVSVTFMRDDGFEKMLFFRKQFVMPLSVLASIVHQKINAMNFSTNDLMPSVPIYIR